MFSFEEGMFSSQQGYSIEKISVSYTYLGFFHHHCLQYPTKNLREPWRESLLRPGFLSVLLFLSISVETGGSGHTKPLESLNRGNRVVISCYLIGGTWYIHWLNQYQRQWNRYQTWWNQYQIMFICYIITKI